MDRIYRAEAVWDGHYEDLGDFRDVDAAWAAVDAFAEETGIDVHGRIRVYDAFGHELDVI